MIIFTISSILFYLYTLYLLVIGGYDPGFFDKIIRILAHNYTKLGLIPYNEFGIVYSPGVFIFTGKILSTNNILEVNYFLSIIYLIITILSLFLISRLIKPKKIHPALIFSYFVSNAIIVHFYDSTSTLSYLLPLLTITLVLNYIKENKFYYLILIISIFLISPFLRWDWMLFIILNWYFLLIILTFSTHILRLKVISNTKLFSFIKLIIISTIGYLFGGLLLYLYLNRLSAVQSAYEFIFLIPYTLTKTYRNLPVPLTINPFDLDFLLYISIIFTILIIIDFIKRYKTKKLSEFTLISILILISYIVAFLPYSLGRSDWQHFIAIWFALIISWIIYFSIINNALSKKVIILFAFTPFIMHFLKDDIFLNPKTNYVNYIIEESNKDCKDKTNNLHPQSIFIGRTNYNQYLYNIVSLYLVKPNVKPATAFIIEEPGVQNSCKYGEIVADQLNNASKPILVFLDTRIHGFDNELTKNMHSCNKIENYLENSFYESIGKCTSYGGQFEIRLYK